MEEIKKIETDCLDCFGVAIVVAVIFFCLGLIVGVLLMPEPGRQKVEQAQEEIRLDIKEIRQRDELAKIIDSLFKERNQVIDWNRNHIILTVEPKAEAEGN